MFEAVGDGRSCCAALAAPQTEASTPRRAPLGVQRAALREAVLRGEASEADAHCGRLAVSAL